MSVGSQATQGPGNELADIEARKGFSLLPNFPLPLSFASLKRWQRQ
jgi:hypothetical protein